MKSYLIKHIISLSFLLFFSKANCSNIDRGDWQTKNNSMVVKIDKSNNQKELNNGIFITTLMKCGTYLLYKCVCLLKDDKNAVTVCAKNIPQALSFLKGRKDRILLWHMPFCPDAQLFELNNIRGLFIYRDPRDRIISAAYFVDHPGAHYYPELKKLSLDERIFRFIKVVKRDYSHFIPWKECSFVYSTKFEDLVGPYGNGNLVAQIREITNIAEQIGITNLSEEKILDVANRLFGKWTFRAGQVGAWKSHFNDEHKKAFKEIAGQLLIDLGYEKDLDW